jgi:hypothetical protein
VLARFFRVLGDPGRLALPACIAEAGRDGRYTRCAVRGARAPELLRLAAAMTVGNAAVAACTRVSATA